jgi:hypothetical protein
MLYTLSMIDSTKVDLDQLPKKFCDGAMGAYNKEVFTFILTSGNSLDAFATTPQIMKSIALWMSAQMQNYEKQFGVINMAPPEIQSPIQAADLGK